MTWKHNSAYPVPMYDALTSWTGERHDWILYPWIARGALTLLTAPAKTGKTTFLLDLIAAQQHGVPFLGQTMRRAPVLYITEQSPAIFKAQADLAGLVVPDTLVYLQARYRLLSLTWEQQQAIVLEAVREHGIESCYYDTWSGLAGFDAEGENDSSLARSRIDALAPILAEGCGIIIAAHQGHARISGSPTPITAARGSTGLGDGVDQALWLRHPVKGKPAHSRRLWAEGRFLDSPTNSVEIIRTTPNGHGGTYPKGGKNAPNTAKWSYVSELGGDTAAPGAPKLTYPAKPYTMEQLRELFRRPGCPPVATRTVRRKLAEIEGVQRLAPAGGLPSRWWVPLGHGHPKGKGG